MKTATRCRPHTQTRAMRKMTSLGCFTATYGGATSSGFVEPSPCRPCCRSSSPPRWPSSLPQRSWPGRASRPSPTTSLSRSSASCSSMASSPTTSSCRPPHPPSSPPSTTGRPLETARAAPCLCRVACRGQPASRACRPRRHRASRPPHRESQGGRSKVDTRQAARQRAVRGASRPRSVLRRVFATGGEAQVGQIWWRSHPPSLRLPFRPRHPSRHGANRRRTPAAADRREGPRKRTRKRRRTTQLRR
mmetsp:Transcript_24135/g.69629  ORF Transcript_24135/g.69629 Transcript_24135/m.69629 type:complete len:248 (+) Transcript_24135:1180-1923(+)